MNISQIASQYQKALSQVASALASQTATQVNVVNVKVDINFSFNFASSKISQVYQNFMHIMYVHTYGRLLPFEVLNINTVETIHFYGIKKILCWAVLVKSLIID